MVGLGTGLSRLTGFLRLLAMSWAIGQNRFSDGYNLANNTPNIIYDLILGGVLSATLVPVFVDHLHDDDDEATNAVVTVAAAAMVAITVLALLAAPLIIRLYTLSADATDHYRTVSTDLLRWFVPQILFYGLTALATALLNARRHFTTPAFAPIINNLLVTALFFALPTINHGRVPTLDDMAKSPGLLALVGIGTTTGVIMMTVILWPALRRSGVRLKWRFQLKHPAVKKVFRLSVWTFGYVLSNQIALAIILILAGRKAAWVSAYNSAYIFFMLPHGLFAVTIMTTFTPDMAALTRSGDRAGLRNRMSLGIRMMTLVVLPASVGYVVLAKPIALTVLKHRALLTNEALVTAEVLQAFAIGLVGFCIYIFAMRVLYAMMNTRLPFYVNLFESILQVTLAVLFVDRWGVVGLAYAFSAAYTIGAVVALRVVYGKVVQRNGQAIVTSLTRMLAASVVMAGALVVVVRAVGSDSFSGSLARTVTGVCVGVPVYIGALAVVKSAELTELVGRFRRNR